MKKNKNKKMYSLYEFYKNCVIFSYRKINKNNKYILPFLNARFVQSEILGFQGHALHLHYTMLHIQKL